MRTRARLILLMQHSKQEVHLPCALTGNKGPGHLDEKGERVGDEWVEIALNYPSGEILLRCSLRDVRLGL